MQTRSSSQLQEQAALAGRFGIVRLARHDRSYYPVPAKLLASLRAPREEPAMSGAWRDLLSCQAGQVLVCPSPSYAGGLFVPNPSTGAYCQHRSACGLQQTVRGGPLTSAAGRGDCHLLRHSVVVCARTAVGRTAMVTATMAGGRRVDRCKGPQGQHESALLSHQPRGHCPKVFGFMGSGVWFPGSGHGLAACRSRRRDGMRWSLK